MPQTLKYPSTMPPVGRIWQVCIDVLIVYKIGVTLTSFKTPIPT